MITQQERIIKKFELQSQRYHKMSLLFYELSQSLRQEAKHKSFKEFKETIKNLGLDYQKINNLSISFFKEVSLKELKGGNS